MTPAEHLAAAEELIGYGDVRTPGEAWHIDQAMTVAALTHAVIALAIELGVPAPTTTQKGA